MQCFSASLSKCPSYAKPRYSPSREHSVQLVPVRQEVSTNRTENCSGTLFAGCCVAVECVAVEQCIAFTSLSSFFNCFDNATPSSLVTHEFGAAPGNDTSLKSDLFPTRTMGQIVLVGKFECCIKISSKKARMSVKERRSEMSYTKYMQWQYL